VQPHAGDAFPLPGNFTLKPRGSGQPLPEPIQKKMEAFFNTSFADVRVHVGPEASSIGALAFTHGTNLYFAPGQYNPQTTNGQQLLGHELTHVVQQRAGRVRNPLGSVVAVVQNPALEAEAERMGLHVASRQTVATGLIASRASLDPPHLIIGSPLPSMRKSAILQQARRVRSPSIPKEETTTKGTFFGIKKTACFGIPQGHFAILDKSTCDVIGTSSLGPCFALIAVGPEKVLFAHVHACDESVVDEFIEKIQSIQPTKVRIVRGKTTTSKLTAKAITRIQENLKTLVEIEAPSFMGTVVFHASDGSIDRPANIIPSNEREYKTGMTQGGLMKADEPLVHMS